MSSARRAVSSALRASATRIFSADSVCAVPGAPRSSFPRLRRARPAHGSYDGAARTLFSAWFAYAPAGGATGLLWLSLAMGVAFGVVQRVPWWRRADEREGGVEAALGGTTG